MMLGLHQAPSDIDVFRFFLATKLGRTVAELGTMPALELLQWRAFYTAKHAIETKKAVS